MPNATSGNVISSSAQVGADVILTGNIKNGEIVNADIAAAAAIVGSKLQELTVGANAGVIPSTGIVNAHVAAAAAIVDTKLAQITTASKVDGAAITGLASVPAGAGILPVANTPAVPPIIDIAPGDVTMADNNNEQTMFSVTIPGGTLGTTGGVRCKLFIDTWNNNGNGSHTLRCKYGATTLVTITFPIDAGGSPKGYVEFILAADGATNAQKGVVISHFEVDHLTMNATQGKYSFGAGNGTSAEDSTADKTLAVTFQQNAGACNIPPIVRLALCEKI
ncbi:MAG: hypothetical protein WC766_06425 [Patescibacteria group bacterium]|jgi:hypothetical protein